MSTPPDEPDVWALIFEQTPTVLRWLLGVLTLGIFSLASWLYRWHRRDMEKQRQHMSEMEQRLDSRMGQLESRLDTRMDEVHRQLVQIAQQTGGNGQR